MNLILLTAFVFAAASLVSLAAGLTYRDLVGAARERIDRRLGVERDAGDFVSPHQRLAMGRFDRWFYELVEDSGSRLGHATAVSLVAGTAIVGCATPLLLLESLLAAAIGLILGAALPVVWWMARRARRTAQMRRHLPQTLEMLADAVRSGQNLEQAAAMVGAQGPAPLNREFADCAAQLRLGQAPAAVLERMSRRIALPEFRLFAMAAVVHRQTGGNLPALVHRLAESARERQQFFGHLRAVTAGSRLSAIGLVVASLAALGLLSYIQPEYLEMFTTHRWGLSLLTSAGVLQLVGIVWASRIMKVDF